MLSRTVTSAVLLLTLATGCSDTNFNKAALQDAPRAEDVARIYDSYHLITKQPVLVDAGLAMLCVGPRLENVDNARKRSGPHAHTSIRIYMNGVAAEHFPNSSKRYPIGSIIIKEKQGLYYGGKTPDRHSKTADGVGGMIKRAAGYDPDNGDWEYFYFEDPSKVEHGKIASCIDCHRGAAAKDFVFGSWATADELDSARGSAE
jgi:hypothetical protein